MPKNIPCILSFKFYNWLRISPKSSEKLSTWFMKYFRNLKKILLKKFQNRLDAAIQLFETHGYYTCKNKSAAYVFITLERDTSERTHH